METTGRPVGGGGEVFLVGSYRTTLHVEEQRNHMGNGGEIHRKKHHVFSAHNPIKRCHLTHKGKARK